MRKQPISLAALGLLCSGVAVAAMPMKDVGAEGTKGPGLASAGSATPQVLRLILGSEDSLRALLMRSGVDIGNSVRAGELIESVAQPAPGTVVKATLGAKHGASWRLASLTVDDDAGSNLRVGRDAAGVLQLVTEHQQQQRTGAAPIRIRGRVGDGLYWSLRSAGASPQVAQCYLQALATRIDVGAVAPGDRFDLVLAGTGTDSSADRALLYAGIDRTIESDLRLVRWTTANGSAWVDPAELGRRQAVSSGLAAPVDAPITSRFGWRRHPILGFARMHQGIDFGARWGSPIVAAADGRVTAAGWAGGYGRQVRVAHADGLATTYSHMSEVAVEPGTTVRRGQLVGYVGSSGFSTGPHLHYEVHRGGRAVNPLGVRLAVTPAVHEAEVAAVKTRLKMLMAVGVPRQELRSAPGNAKASGSVVRRG